ncbi:MAG: hypothetical protein JKY96_00865, partial [Phycisphaerales bacterium]|nr:hypothetical protein [Phycisphaerales bacterium]
MSLKKNVSRATTMSALASAVMISVLGSSAIGSTESERAYAAQLRNQTLEEGGWAPDELRRDNSSMRISVLMQTRYVASIQEKTASSAQSQTTIGFLIPRAQVSIEGNIVSSRLSYKLTMDFGDAELGRGRGTLSSVTAPGGQGVPSLLDAYAQYNFEGKREGYYLKVGQFKHIMHTEEAIEAQYQLAVDRSLTNEFFNLGYTQGVALGRVQRDIAWQVSVNDGGRFFGSQDVGNSLVTNGFEADVSVDVRFDWKLSGSWEQFADFTSFQGSQSGLKLGFGVSWLHQGATGPGGYSSPLFGPPVDQAEVASWTFDGQWEGDGWSVFAAVMGNSIDWQFDTGVGFAISNYGFVVQGGYFGTEKTEYFARFEGIFLDSQIANGFGISQNEPAMILTVGLNYFVVPESHAAKFTFDASYSFGETSGFLAGVTGSDTLPDPNVTTATPIRIITARARTKSFVPIRIPP